MRGVWRFWIVLAATGFLPATALAHPDVTTDAGTLTYLIASAFGAALLLAVGLL